LFVRLFDPGPGATMSAMRKSFVALTIAALAALATAACTTGGAGTGSGNVRGTRKPVAFTWQGTDSVSGNITDRDMDREFIKEYSGRVLANLHSDTGNHMRCRFRLISPSRGMAGGGEGRCQLSETGTEINAEFPRQS
jgi:hypothetical protein